jgi:hypothetical protein
VQLPALQLPAWAKVRAVVPSTQVALGGWLQVTPAQGSPAQAPPWQPFGQEMLIDAYEHEPLLHVPGELYDRSVMLSAHSGTGGWSHETPAQGSPAQAPSRQPLGQAVSLEA